MLIRFRENYVGFMGDISKMYNSVRIPLLDQHCHRYLWRNMNPKIQPETFVITRVNMGDKPSGAIASLALRKTAEMKNDVFPVECETTLNSSYIGDIIDNAKIITTNITNILKSGDFNVKDWVMQGDYFKYTVKLNFSKKQGNLRSEQDLTREDFRHIIPLVLTKRMLLSQLNGIYDALGLLSTFIIKEKILLRQL